MIFKTSKIHIYYNQKRKNTLIILKHNQLILGTSQDFVSLVITKETKRQKVTF